MIKKLQTLLQETRKVPRNGKQRCFRLDRDLDEELQEIARAAQSVLGYNVSVAHISRMILKMYSLEVKETLMAKVEHLQEVAFYEDPLEDRDPEDDDLEDTEDADEGQEEVPEPDSEEEYVRRLLNVNYVDTSTWEP